MDKNYYMVRILGEQFNFIEQKSVVAIGWSDWNMAKLGEQTVIEQIGKACDEWGFAPQMRGRRLNEIARFLNIKKGDYILVPHWSNIWLAVAGDEYIYDVNSKDIDLANQLQVNFIKDKDGNTRCVDRNQLSERLSRRLHLRGATVLDLCDFKNEIERIFNDEEYSVSRVAAEQEDKLVRDFKSKLLLNIRKGNVYLKSGGIGLEELVRELFECEKYTAQVLSKRAFKGYGDADVRAESKFQSILIQVKHHDGDTDIWGIEQLKEIKKNGEDNEYDKLMLITSGNINEAVKKEADCHGILTMDGEQLIDWIYENINQLSPNAKAKLGISVVPTIYDGLREGSVLNGQ